MGVLMIELKINGQPHSIDAEPDMPLLWALRELVGLTGTSSAAAWRNAAPAPSISTARRRSCITAVSDAVGTEIVTIEASPARWPRPCGTTWVKMDAQCGYCIRPGDVSRRLAGPRKKKPSDAEIDDAMSGNLCRCAHISPHPWRHPRSRQAAGGLTC
jgi:isoquinoline 1-oxidoreductase alpha subunit